MSRLLITLLVFVLVGHLTVAQQDKTLFLMHQVPQANIVNPAVGIKCKYYVGIPLFSSIHLNYSNTLCTVSDGFSDIPSTDSLTYNLANIVNKTHKVDLISAEQQLTLLDFGYSWDDHYLNFAIRENVHAFGTIPQDLVYLAWYGNSHFLGETANLNGMRVNMIHFREYTFGYANQVNKKLRIGFHAKLLFGKSNVTTSVYQGSLYTNPNTFAINTSATYEINSSAPVTITTNPDGTVSDVELNSNVSPSSYLFNRSNMGFALDFGMIYQYTDKVQFSASVLDLGTIFWRSNTNTFRTRGNYSYQGEVNGVGNSNNTLDSIRNSYDVYSSASPYFSNLTPRVYLGVTYQFAYYLNAGSTFYTEILANKIHPSIGLSINTVNFKKYSASLLWSAQNSVYTNIGVGVGAQFGNVQLHLMSDNVPAFFALDETKNVNLRFGANLMLGCSARKKSGPKAIACQSKSNSRSPKGQSTGYKPLNRSKPKR